jgi:hypothetical protein
MVRLGGSEAPRVLLLALLSVAGAGSGCTTNHDALARQPKAGSSSGGAGGTSGFGAGAFGNTGNDGSVGGRQNPDAEAPGDNVLTIVNGVVDAPGVRLCFARVGDDGQTSDFVGSPLPELAYAGASVQRELDGLSFADDMIQPWVISGDFSRLKGLDCQAAVALAESEEAKVTPSDGDAAAGGQGGAGQGGAAPLGAAGMPELPLELPTLRARPMAALPAGTVDIGRSILLVMTGCIGGAAYTDHIETSACGPAYSPETPTLQPIIMTLSRVVGIEQVGLQGVHASQATGSVDIRASGDKGAVALVFASALDFGEIKPRPADVRFTPSELGVEQTNYGLQAVGNDGGVLYQEAWSDVLAASGLDTPRAARTYTAVFVGPDPLLIKQGWWNPSAFTLVDNDPTRP